MATGACQQRGPQEKESQRRQPAFALLVGTTHDDHPANPNFRVRAFDASPGLTPQRVNDRLRLLGRVESKRAVASSTNSPTLVACLRDLSTAFSAWNTSAPQRSASAKVGAPQGTIMNSCTSTLLSACAPPLIMFIIGTGNVLALSPPR